MLGSDKRLADLEPQCVSCTIKQSRGGLRVSLCLVHLYPPPIDPCIARVTLRCRICTIPASSRYVTEKVVGAADGGQSAARAKLPAPGAAAVAAVEVDEDATPPSDMPRMIRQVS